MTARAPCPESNSTGTQPSRQSMARHQSRVVVIRTSHFDALAGLHLDRVAILSLIFPFCLNLGLHVKIAE